MAAMPRRAWPPWAGSAQIRDDLEPIADFELHATLDRIVAQRDPTRHDPEATLTYAEVSARGRLAVLASSGRMPRGAWARSRWPSTPSSTARSR